jgi:hypothetical protein
MSKNNFILYKDYKPNIDILNDEQAGKLFKAIFCYVEDRTEPNFKDGMLVMAFQFIKNQLERDLEKYKNQVERNRENGAKGGRPKQTKPKKAKKPTGLNGNPNKPKKGDNDYVYDYVYDYEYDYEDEIIKDLFYDFLTLRKKLKAVNTQRAIDIQVKTLNKYDLKTKKEMLEKSISNSWKSVYEPKGTKQNGSSRNEPDWVDEAMNDL